MRVGVTVRARSGDRVTARARARARVGVGARVRVGVGVGVRVRVGQREHLCREVQLVSATL